MTESPPPVRPRFRPPYRRRRFLPTGSLRLTMLAAAIAGAVFGAIVPLEADGDPRVWSAWNIVRHFAAARNCTAARQVGLAPAYRGEPGYWPSHDADNDGIACEPWPRRW